MAIARRGTPLDGVISNGTSFSVTKPTGVVSGDVWVIFLACDENNTPTFTPPTGFVDISSGGVGWSANDRVRAYRKVCDGTEGASVTFTTTTVVFGHWATIAYSGASNSTPEDVATTENADNTAATTKTQVSQTTVTNGAQIIGFWSTRGTAGLSGTPQASPAGTEEIDVDDVNNFYVYLEDLNQTTAGAIALSFTASSAVSPWAYIQVALRPAGAAPSGYPKVIGYQVI